MNNEYEKPSFVLLDTPINVDPSALVTPVTLGTLTVWYSRRSEPNLSWAARLRKGLFVALAYEIATFTHFVGHILSAKLGDAPMDEFRLSAPMPRTIYFDDGKEISPQAHRMRAIGGPVVSLLAFVATLWFRGQTVTQTIFRELLDKVTFFHGLIGLGSLFPMSDVDGGSIAKWTLVEQGRSQEEAEQIVEKANLTLWSFVALIGVVAWLAQRFLRKN